MNKLEVLDMAMDDDVTNTSYFWDQYCSRIDMGVLNEISYNNLDPYGKARYQARECQLKALEFKANGNDLSYQRMLKKSENYLDMANELNPLAAFGV